MAKAKRVRGIDCDAAAAAGIRLVLITRFKDLCSFREAALKWTRPEGVHSMRVASRRLRSALRDFGPYLRKRGLTSIQKEMRSLADALGEVRDQDVGIMALEKIATHAPSEVLPALEAYIDSRKKVRERARQELKSVLEKSEFEKLKSSFMEDVDMATATNERKLTFRELSRAIILDRLKELEELSDGLFNPFEIQALHEMRIAAKRLRYALELFQECWGESIAIYPKRAARIQSALGDVHDCDVWIENFGKQISDARKDKQNEELAALVWLLGHFVKLRTKHLRRAFDSWCQWEVHEVSGKLRAALHSDAGGETDLTSSFFTSTI